MSPIFGLRENAGRPMKFREQHCTRRCQCQSNPCGSDREQGHSAVRVVLKFANFVGPQGGRNTAINPNVSDGLVVAIQRFFDRVQNRSMMSENKNLVLTTR
jgi:hypothetical protein